MINISVSVHCIKAAINARKLAIHCRVLVYKTHFKSDNAKKMAASAMHSQDWQN